MTLDTTNNRFLPLCSKPRAKRFPHLAKRISISKRSQDGWCLIGPVHTLDGIAIWLEFPNVVEALKIQIWPKRASSRVATTWQMAGKQAAA